MSGGYLGNIYNSAASGNNYMSDDEHNEMLLKSTNQSDSFMDTGAGIGIGAGVLFGIIIIIVVIMVIRYFQMSDNSIIELAKANRQHTNRNVIIREHGKQRHHKHGRKHGKIRVKLAL